MANYVDTNDDNGGVHTNSGIMNKAAWLITEGGTHSGIDVEGLGIGKTRPLYYDVLVYRLHDNADFMDAREQTIAQAWDYVFDNMEHGLSYRYGFEVEDICSIVNGFAAVGIGSADRDCDFRLDDVDDQDDDGDGVTDGEDNCHNHPNPGQGNIDGDMFGDACDTDKDDDGWNNDIDNCPNRANPDQADRLNDGVGDLCDDREDCGDGTAGDGFPWPEDNCPNFCNRNQLDTDDDDYGDVCDNDDDNDGVPDNWPDNCPTIANNDQADSDADGVGDACDNCPGIANSNQSDIDGDDDGDECDDDDDGDGVTDEDDVCPMDSDPEQLVFNGIGLNCYPDLENILGGPDGFEGLIAFNDPALAASIPFFPCVGDICPDWLPENFQTRIHLSLPHEMPVRIVDDRGFVVRKGGLGSLQSDASGMQWVEKSLDFHPSADSFFIPPAGLSTGGIGQDLGEISLNQTSSGPPFRGRRYFLQILPAGSVTGGQAYPFEIRVESRLANMDDHDNDGYIADIDCNDTDATIHPDAPETCDGVDNDCDGKTDEDISLDDGNACTEDLCDPGIGVYHIMINPDDGNACTEDRCIPELGVFHEVIDPDDGNACTEDRCLPELGVFHELINPDDGNACTEDRCDPGLGVFHSLIDPDDGNACTYDICDPQSGVHHIPLNPFEVCDGVDNNCNGQVDEGVTQTWYRDGDNDGYSDGFTTESCDELEGFKKDWQLIGLSGDCNDTNANINPDENEVCGNNIDDDCDGVADPWDTDCINALTLPGQDVEVVPVDPSTGTTPVTIQFSNVTGSGVTGVTTGGTGQSPPPGFKLGTPPVYYEITTTASYAGQIELCINYSGSSFINESATKLFHNEGGSWTDVTSSLDILNNIICGKVSSLSPFAIFEPDCPDSDGDGYTDCNDNCPGAANPDQADSDSDNTGDLCDTIPDLSARAKDRKADIVWSPVTGATGYNIYRSTTQGGPYTLIKANHQTTYCTYADFGLVNGTTYYYVVSWINVNGSESLNSNEASAKPISLRR